MTSVPGFGCQTPFLHLTNGDSARVLIERAGIPGTVVVWRDVLHDGPVPAGISAAELREVRADFIACRGYASHEEARGDLALRDRYLAEAAHRDELVLWFEHDLFDQLQLVQILDRLAELDLPPRTSFIQSSRHLAELSAAELQELWRAQREPLSKEQLELGQLAWAAFRSPDPTAIETLLSHDTSALPFLRPSLARHLEEFPWRPSGLARTESQLLEAIAAGATTDAEAFSASQTQEEAAFMGNLSAFGRLSDLSLGERPLVRLEPLGLTPDGVRVLQGKADRLELCGIDRWLGGVHLEGRTVWRWDPSEERLVAPQPERLLR